MTATLALYEMTSVYPELPQDMLATPALEFVAAWRDGAIADAIAAAEDLRLLRMIWSAKPTMVHPSHVAALADEFARVVGATSTNGDALAELISARELCIRVGASGDWIVSIGP